MNFVKPAEGAFSATGEHLSLARPHRKWPIAYSSVGKIAVFFDILVILFCGLGCEVFYNLETFGTSGEIYQSLGPPAVVAFLFVSLMKSRDLYSPAEMLSLKSQILSVATAWISVFLFLAGAAFALKVGELFSRFGILSFAALGLATLTAQRVLYRDFLTRGLRGQRFTGRNAILIVDDTSSAESEIAPILVKHGYQLDHQFVLPFVQRNAQWLEDFVSEVVGYVRGSDIEEVIVGVDPTRWGELHKLLSGLRVLPLPISLLPVGAASDILSRPTRLMGDSVCIELHRGPLGTVERAIKRAFDVLSALFGLLLFLPLLTITAVLIKLDSPGPVLFRQRRCGFNGRLFNIYKFRTMSVMEDGPTICQAGKSDSRVTRIGKWLRRTSIDELPQLLNVLNGAMSLVGPRPHALAHDNQFYKAVRNYAFRQHVKPGLTGWAQVNGQRGPTPTVEDIRRRVEFDLWYIDNWSLRLDFVIIVRTFVELMRGRNAY
jgi:Undecaprenyl-phosphate glucose phosphotransferase